jgi:hypothetical protein
MTSSTPVAWCSSIGVKGAPVCPVGGAVVPDPDAQEKRIHAFPTLPPFVASTHIMLDCRKGWTIVVDEHNKLLGSIACVNGHLVVKKGLP